MSKNQLPVVEIFSSMQGEGIHTGAPATFIRLAGCNLQCSFCDTDFSFYSVMGFTEIFDQLLKYKNRLVVITGGEPLIHEKLHDFINQLRGFLPDVLIEIETNGTIKIPEFTLDQIDFVSMSPKVPLSKCQVGRCNSLKILYPYLPAVTAEDYGSFPSSEYFIQPIEEKIDGIEILYNTRNRSNIFRALEEVHRLGHPWRLSIQLHKVLGLR